MRAIRADRLFDGQTHGIKQHVMMLVDEGRIIAIEQGAVDPPAHAEIINLGDVTLIPGMFDVHVHLGFDAGPDPVARMLADDDLTLLLRMATHAQRALRAGVTTVRDLGDRNFLALTLREWYRSGGELGPEILAAGPPLTVTGGHCHFMNGEVDGELGIRQGVRERVKRGVDVIKVMATGGHMTPGTNPLAPQFTLTELRAAVEEAHRLNKRLTAHAHATVGIALAVEAGVDGIEHCSFQVEDGVYADQALIERIAAAGIAVSPTVGRPPSSPMTGDFAARREARMAVYRRMHAAGCRFVTGTDAGIAGVPHDSAPWGIQAFTEAGLSNFEALRAGTAVAAEACGIEAHKGTLVAGKDADIVAVAGNPLEEIGAIHEVRAVFRAGVRV